MPKIPKNVPKWIYLLFDYIAAEERSNKVVYSPFLKSIEKHWNNFVAKHSAPPTPRKKKDPSSSFKRAIDDYKESLVGLPEKKQKKMVNEFKDQLKALPPELRNAIQNGQEEDIEEKDPNEEEEEDLSPLEICSRQDIHCAGIPLENPPKHTCREAPQTSANTLLDTGQEAILVESNQKKKKLDSIPWTQVEERTDNLFVSFKTQAERVGLTNSHREELVASVG